mmetsp:Transcript_33938/g.101220  ORF Transcript_33938/g.101220 Transcript_33938/m.101220 type:complete len:419 (-) Transcript_33938:148-1404(-)
MKLMGAMDKALSHGLSTWYFTHGGEIERARARVQQVLELECEAGMVKDFEAVVNNAIAGIESIKADASEVKKQLEERLQTGEFYKLPKSKRVDGIMWFFNGSGRTALNLYIPREAVRERASAVLEDVRRDAADIVAQAAEKRYEEVALRLQGCEERRDQVFAQYHFYNELTRKLLCAGARAGHDHDPRRALVLGGSALERVHMTADAYKNMDDPDARKRALLAMWDLEGSDSHKDKCVEVVECALTDSDTACQALALQVALHLLLEMELPLEAVHSLAKALIDRVEDRNDIVIAQELGKVVASERHGTRVKRLIIDGFKSLIASEGSLISDSLKRNVATITGDDFIRDLADIGKETAIAALEDFLEKHIGKVATKGVKLGADRAAEELKRTGWLDWCSCYSPCCSSGLDEGEMQGHSM